MSEDITLHDKLRKSCRKVNGDVEEDNIVVDTHKCVTQHGELKVRETRRRIFSDKTKVVLSPYKADFTASGKNVEEINTVAGRLVAKTENSSFDLKGGKPM